MMLASSQLLKLTVQLKMLRLIETEIWSLRYRSNIQSGYNKIHDQASRTYSTLKKTKYSRVQCLLGHQRVAFMSDESDDRTGSPFPDEQHGNDLTENVKPDLTNIVASEASETRCKMSVLEIVGEAETEQIKDATAGVESNNFNLANVESYLTEMDMPYSKGYTCFLTVCPKLGKLAMKKRKAGDIMYVNSTSGYFYCRYCGNSGSWSLLKDNIAHVKSKKIRKNLECFKDVVDVKRTTDDVHPSVRKYLESTEDFTVMSDDTFEIIQSLFDWHGIEKRTFENYKVKYRIEENRYWVVFPIYSPVGMVTSVTVYSGWVLEDGDIKTSPVQTYPRSKESTLPFGWQQQSKVRNSNKVVITTSEAHAMAVHQDTNVMGLALTSLSHLPQEILPHLENYNIITLWLGTDMKAWETAKVYAKKLNDNRCYIFRPNMVTKMPLEALQDGDDIKEVLEKARLISNKSILTFENLKQEVYSEFAHYTQVAGIQWSRYTKLNQLLKGHRRGELTLLTGPTGSGKTTFASDYSLDLCMQGVNTLWGSFEISNVRLIKMMMQQFSGKNIAKHLDEFDPIAEEFSLLPMYFMEYFGVEEINKVLEAMWHAVYVHDISHVIVDNLQFMMGMNFTEKNRFFKQDQIVTAFRKFATEKNCHVTLIIHPRKINEGEELSTASIFGSAKVSQEADNILLIQDQKLTKQSGRKYIQIAKNRFDGDLGVMTLTFNKNSLTFNTIEKKKVARQPEDLMDSEETNTTTEPDKDAD